MAFRNITENTDKSNIIAEKFGSGDENAKIFLNFAKIRIGCNELRKKNFAQISNFTMR